MNSMDNVHDCTYVCIPMKFPAKSLGNGAANTGLAYTRSTNKAQYRTCMNQKKSYCYKNVCTYVRTYVPVKVHVRTLTIT